VWSVCISPNGTDGHYIAIIRRGRFSLDVCVCVCASDIDSSG